MADANYGLSSRPGWANHQTDAIPRLYSEQILKEDRLIDKQASHLGRREFLTAAATGVGLAPPASAQEAAAKPKGSGKFRVVLVGTGGRGNAQINIGEIQ